MRALQQLDLDRFPFKDYLISCQSAVNAPAYMRGGSGVDKYNLASVLDGGERTTFPLLGSWPELETSMDNSQLSAFKQALTKEFAIIQGPPGTGKTFVGLKVMRALLDNRHLRRKVWFSNCFVLHAHRHYRAPYWSFALQITRLISSWRASWNLKRILFVLDLDQNRTA